MTKKERERIEKRLRRLQQYLSSPARVRLSGPSRKEMDAAREYADIQRQLEYADAMLASRERKEGT